MDTIPAIEARLVASIHQQVATFFKRTTPVERAMDLCRKLDAVTDDDAEDMLIRIGNALGGESANGFVATLTAQLNGIEEKAFEDARWPDYSPGRGGNDPDHWVSAGLQDAIDAEQDEYCREFLRDPDVMAFEAAMRVAA